MRARSVPEYVIVVGVASDGDKHSLFVGVRRHPRQCGDTEETKDKAHLA